MLHLWHNLQTEQKELHWIKCFHEKIEQYTLTSLCGGEWEAEACNSPPGS